MNKTPIQTTINGKQHLIVYIEYHDSKPHHVITLSDGNRRTDWDFDLNMNWDEYMYYNSGGGGKITNMHGPHFFKKNKNSGIWHTKDVTFSKKNPPRNCIIYSSPIPLNNNNTWTVDPFLFARQEVDKIIYCKKCDGYYDQDGCDKHMNMWEYKYNDGLNIE